MEIRIMQDNGKTIIEKIINGNSYKMETLLDGDVATISLTPSVTLDVAMENAKEEKITLDMNTRIFPLINPGLYGTELGESWAILHDDYVEEFNSAICKYGKENMEEMLKDVFGSAFSIRKVSFHHPQFYNYENDWLEFELEMPKRIIEEIKEDYEKDVTRFLEFADKNFGSHPGFISFAPCTRERFEEAINSRSSDIFDFNRAVGMFLYYVLTGSLDTYYHQRDFEDSVIEEGNKNGWWIVGEEEE